VRFTAVLFPSLVLGQITGAADDHLLFRADDNWETRHAAVVSAVKTSFDSRYNVDEHDFQRHIDGVLKIITKCRGIAVSGVRRTTCFRSAFFINAKNSGEPVESAFFIGGKRADRASRARTGPETLLQNRSSRWFGTEIGRRPPRREGTRQ
jgi:hypothetical protein